MTREHIPLRSRPSHAGPSHRSTTPTLHAFVGGLLALVVAGVFDPVRLVAQESDFLFRVPRVTFAFHGGFHRAGADSEVFDFTTRNLTVGRRDFDAIAFRGELSVRISPRIDIALDVGRSKSETTSETRDFIGTDGLPIVQETSLTQVPIAVTGKYYLRPRGESVGQFAWIPRRWSVYVGGGVGFANYTFEQNGEFVVEETLEIVEDRLKSSSTGALGHLVGGVELSVTPRTLLIVDGRYRWATADMNDDWAGFEDIDLSGFSFSLGIGVRL
ncbi:MAG: hypothetical protein RQ745_04175 [Longimicrobiales bacterium]|nr:hypothetical protein [Longimicrobiales bacterium]